MPLSTHCGHSVLVPEDELVHRLVRLLGSFGGQMQQNPWSTLVRFALLAFVAGMSSVGHTQLWREGDKSMSWTFLEDTELKHYNFGVESQGRAFVRTADEEGQELGCVGNVCIFEVLIVFDKEQRTLPLQWCRGKDSCFQAHLYWQRGLSGQVFCGQNQMRFLSFKFLDKDGYELVGNFDVPDSKLFDIRSSENSRTFAPKIYSYVCKHYGKM